MAGNLPFKESRYIHKSFQHLEKRAEKGCPVCRIIRCALYSAQITRSQANRLSTCQSEVKVEVVRAAPQSSRPISSPDLLITLKTTDEGIHNECRVACMPEYDGERLNLKMSADYESPNTFTLIKNWMDQCSIRCNELAWSRKLPTYLIQILHEESRICHLRLVRFNDFNDTPIRQSYGNQVRYACLSYSWGDTNSKDMPAEDKASIKNGKTTPHNLEARKKGFLSSQLPNTMRHAILLMRRIGIDYIWIDSVCIVGDEKSAGDNISEKDDWNHNALRMHEVYGNACLTLCVCATNKATEKLFFERAAWKYKSVPCTLGDTWLTNYDVPLNEVRRRAPIFNRGWILQEERLSARILYWSGQRLYWSCGCAQRTEMPHYTNGKKSKRNSLVPLQGCFEHDWLQSPQKFLQLRGGGRTEEIHPLWLDMVQDFTQRNMFTRSDKKPAMSGLAAQYLASFTAAKEEYIVGLWRATFAKDLAWKVCKAQLMKDSHSDIAPTFSWMSLPFECETRTRELADSPCESFELLDERSSRNKDRLGDDVLERIEDGNRIRQVTVKCRIRKFLEESSSVSWDSIHPNNEFDFSSYLDRPIHARNSMTGKIVMREIHKDPVFAQLDYQPSVVPSADQKSGFEHSLYALEIGKRVMLLVERVPDSPQHTYRRVGIAWTRRENFFDLVTEIVKAVLT